MFQDRYGNEIDRKYSDYFNPITAYQLAKAFPNERPSALRALRNIEHELEFYDDNIGKIQTSNYSIEDKYLMIVWVETMRSLDPLSKRRTLLLKFLALTKTHAEKPDMLEPLNIEKAREFPLEQLFDPESPRQTNASISCCCPLHHDKTPSFVIFRKSNRFKCFGCGEHGDAIQLYMKLHNVDFKLAVRSLT